ncbi:MAG TPA: NAD(P)/FAD-dependent oxidoreductase [Candidatus Binatia bacterium]|nr:NAD(P)/FAD-dependent oxidoreductase [Candidatus Binatia bacterium]
MAERRTPSIGIIGGGFTGLTAAHRLAQAGYHVEVFERSHQLGGLAMTFEVDVLGGARLEKYYHHLFTSDRDIIALADELGVAIDWPSPPMGMFHGGRVYPFTTPADLLRFTPLSVVDRVRLGATGVFLQRFPNPKPFESVNAVDWYRRYAGKAVTDAVFGPMLRVKFGRNAERVAMVWMWGKFRLRATSRTKGGTQESLGYVRGSFGTLLDRLIERVRALGGVLHPGAVVRRVESTPTRLLPSDASAPEFISNLRRAASRNGGPDWASFRGAPIRIDTSRGSYSFDAVISTVAPVLLADLTPVLPAAWRQTANALDHSGVVCTIVILKRSLSPIYWMNVSDVSVPYGGLIEHTNYIPPSHYNGRHIVYVSHYTYPDEEFFGLSSDQVLARYLPHFKRVNPAFDASWIEKVMIMRDHFAQPIVTVNYGERLLPYATPVPGLFSASMAQLYPEDRGTNYAVRGGNQVADVVRRYLTVEQAGA